MDPHAPTMGLFFIHRTNQGHSCRNPPANMTGASHSAVGQVAENPVLTLITCGVANGQGSSPQLLLTDPPAHTVGSHSTSPLDSPSLNGSFVVGGSQMEPRYSLTRPFFFPSILPPSPLPPLVPPLNTPLSLFLCPKLPSSLLETCTPCLCWHPGTMHHVVSVKLIHRMGNAVEKHLFRPLFLKRLSLVNFRSVLPRIRGQTALSGSSEWSHRTQGP